KNGASCCVPAASKTSGSSTSNPPVQTPDTTPRTARRWSGFPYNMFLPLLFRHLVIGNAFFAQRNIGTVHGFRISRYQRMPVKQRLTLSQQSVSAGFRQPAELLGLIRR